jgi:uncharacterized repeat protein (TIGR01451 family)
MAWIANEKGPPIVKIQRPCCPVVPLVIAACWLVTPGAVLAQSFTVGADLVDLSQIPGNETDPAIAISLLNPSDMVVAAAADADSPGLLIAISTNMGANWATNIIATNNNSQGLLPASGGPSVAWDIYGNLFVAYVPATSEGVVVALSTNGGHTFAALTNLAALDSTDQPRITTPPAGAAAGSAWIVYKDYSLAARNLVVQGIRSSGLGTNGTFTPVELVPDSTNGGFADIAVGPAGEVLVAFQDNSYNSGLARILVSVNTNEITSSGLGTNDFPPPVIAASNAIGGFTYIPAEMTGIGFNAAPSAGWDCDQYSADFDRAYLTYSAFGTNGNVIVDFCFSTNGGAGWSGGSQVNDDTNSNDHFLPRMAVDPVTGIIGILWLDCRNDQGAGSVVITRMITNNVTLNGLMVTNLIIIPTNGFQNSPSVTYSWTDNSGGNGSNLTVLISANNIFGTLATNNSSGDIYIYGGTNTDFVLSAQGQTTNFNAIVTIFITDNYPDAFTSGGGQPNQSAIGYATVSLDGGMTFQSNSPLVFFTRPINPPAYGFASLVTGSDSLTGWGHCTALAAYGANFFPVWPDNSDILTNNPDGVRSNFDLYTIGGGLSVPTADVSVFVTNSPNPVLSDGALTYTMIVSNNGPRTAAPLTVIDTLPPSVTFERAVPAVGGSYFNFVTNIVFYFPALAPRKTLTNTILVTATRSALATNVAVVGSPLTDLVPTNNTNVLIVLISGQNLALGMSTSETNVLIGDTVTNWITVTNLGPAVNQPVFITNILSLNWTNIAVQAPGSFSISNNVVVINLGLLPVNESVTSIVTAVALGRNGFASSSATVFSLDVSTNLENSSAGISYLVNDEDLAIGISASPTNVNLGDTVTYTVTVTNLGPSYNGDIMVTNLISTNLGQLLISQSQGTGAVTSNGAQTIVIFDLGPLPPGQVATQVISAVALAGPPLATNIAMLGSVNFDTDASNNIATSVISINGEDLGIAVSASPATLQVGQTVTYTEIVTNLGPSTNGAVLVTNVLSSRLGQLAVLQPANNYAITNNVVVFNLGTLGAGQAETLTLTAVAQSAGTANNRATVFSADFDTNLANNSALATVTITATLPMISNLVVTPLASSAFISWNTGALATGQVQYGLTPSCGTFSSVSAIASSNHVVLLTGLVRDTNYYFNVLSWVAGTLYTTNGAFSTTDTLILNTGDADYSGGWIASSVGSGIYGGYYNYANTTRNNPSAWALYAPNIPAAGAYDVAIWFPQSSAFTSNAPVYVSGATNEVFFAVNQAVGGGTWQTLVTNMYFAAGSGGNVTIYNDTGNTNRSVVANAMRWLYDTNQDYPANGALPAWWANYYFGTNANVSGAADSDGDGYSNYAKYVLGADPTDPNSRLNFGVALCTNGAVMVSFSPWQGGRAYQLLGAATLTDPVWTVLTNEVSVDTNGDGIFTISQPNAADGFYRLSAQIVPQ